MAQSLSTIATLSDDLIASMRAALEPQDGRLGRVRRYLNGDHDPVYTPRGANTEYAEIARKSITNWLPLISKTYVQSLFVDGYRPARAADNAAAWSDWQANGMDARQTVTTASAIEYGYAYGLTLPSAGPNPYMRPLSALKAQAWYEDDEDEFPAFGIRIKGRSVNGAELYEAFDDENVYTLRIGDDGKIILAATEAHGLGVTPLVRFRNRLDDTPVGIVEPLIPVQDRVNETVFVLMMSLQYAAHRQRWATGLAIPVDPDTDEPVGSFSAAVDRLWVSDNPEAKFGEFGQTDPRGTLESYTSAVRTMSALGQVSPNVLTGDINNLSAEALAALSDQTRKQSGQFETILGESYEQWLRLTRHAAGDRAGALDLSAEVRWRDNEARALAATVDALGKMVTMLQVPPTAIWEKIPGVTDGDIERWKDEAGSADGMALLAAALQADSEPATAPESDDEGEG